MTQNSSKNVTDMSPRTLCDLCNLFKYDIKSIADPYVRDVEGLIKLVSICRTCSENDI